MNVGNMAALFLKGPQPPLQSGGSVYVNGLKTGNWLTGYDCFFGDSSQTSVPQT